MCIGKELASESLFSCHMLGVFKAFCRYKYKHASYFIPLSLFIDASLLHESHNNLSYYKF